eukprot:2270964-Rhodomonas_salina.2
MSRSRGGGGGGRICSLLAHRRNRGAMSDAVIHYGGGDGKWILRGWSRWSCGDASWSLRGLCCRDDEDDCSHQRNRHDDHDGVSVSSQKAPQPSSDDGDAQARCCPYGAGLTLGLCSESCADQSCDGGDVQARCCLYYASLTRGFCCCVH